MTAQSRPAVLRMPGVHCALYAVGHCLYAERLNPDLEPAWQCSELQRFAQMYDVLLEQAERFSLSPDEVNNLWESRIASVPAPGEGCATYAPGGCGGCSGCGSDTASARTQSETEEQGPRTISAVDFVSMLGCRYSDEAACVLRMPLCEGMCRHFIRRDTE